ILSFRYGSAVWEHFGKYRVLRPALMAVLLFAHFIPFGFETARHLNFSNDRQKSLMHFAENMTDPVKDRVYDGIGLVPSRASIHFLWYLHSLNMQTFLSGSGPRVREMLAAKPPAVLIQSYRTDWLSDEDHDF